MPKRRRSGASGGDVVALDQDAARGRAPRNRRSAAAPWSCRCRTGRAGRASRPSRAASESVARRPAARRSSCRAGRGERKAWRLSERRALRGRRGRARCRSQLPIQAWPFARDQVPVDVGHASSRSAPRRPVRAARSGGRSVRAGRRKPSRAASSCASTLPTNSMNALACVRVPRSLDQADRVVDHRRAAPRKQVAERRAALRLREHVGELPDGDQPLPAVELLHQEGGVLRVLLGLARRGGGATPSPRSGLPVSLDRARRIMPKRVRMVPLASGSRIRIFPFQRGVEEVVPVVRAPPRASPPACCRPAPAPCGRSRSRDRPAPTRSAARRLGPGRTVGREQPVGGAAGEDRRAVRRTRRRPAG